MKLKYYLRGLGIGIFITALIMGISLGGKKEMSDAEVIARAKELGMTESGRNEDGTLSEMESVSEELQESAPEEAEQGESVQPETAGTESEEESSSSEEEREKTEKSGKQDADGNEESSAEKQTEGEKADEPQEENNTPDGQEGDIIAGQVVSITVVSGDDSSTVSRKLEEAGLVVSASTYDRYLCDNGYAKKLSPGTYEIAIGSSEETIAKVITKSR